MTFSETDIQDMTEQDLLVLVIDAYERSTRQHKHLADVCEAVGKTRQALANYMHGDGASIGPLGWKAILHMTHNPLIVRWFNMHCGELFTGEIHQ